MARSGTSLLRAALVLVAAGLGAWGAAAGAEEKPTSGPAVGSDTATFAVQDVTGPAKGKQLCYI
jgi:hypothetical protein